MHGPKLMLQALLNDGARRDPAVSAASEGARVHPPPTPTLEALLSVSTRRGPSVLVAMGGSKNADSRRRDDS